MSDESQTNPVHDRIRTLLSDNDVVLFMKGNRHFPSCGFSSAAVHILKELGHEFKDVNVLRDPEIRAGIKTYGDWPTIPQLYIRGELIGGRDIMVELFESGELATKLSALSVDSTSS